MNLIDLTVINNKIHPQIRLNSICPYFTMFPLEFPYKLLRYQRKSNIIFDPFCGRGTTNYAARLLGMRSYGIDSNPIAQVIAQSKLLKVESDLIVERCRQILERVSFSVVPEGEFWEYAYHPTTLQEICKIREYFLSEDVIDDVGCALRAILLGVLHGPVMKIQPSYLSNQMPRTYSTKPNYSVAFWRKNSMLPMEVRVLDVVRRKAEYIFNDYLPQKVDGQIILGDSRNGFFDSEVKFDWIITSPPYFGMSTYEQDQWLRNWFLGGSSTVDYSQKSQIKHGSEETFIRDLANVWEKSTINCNENARMVIRFGALPSKSKISPKEIIKKSLEKSNCGWTITTIRSAGIPLESNRQANQFRTTTGKYIEEIDIYAILKKKLDV